LARLYLDHNVARDVATHLRLAGHEVRTAREIRTESAGDDEHLALAYQQGWVFITHNITDFELLHDAWRRWSALWGVNVTHPGILALEPGAVPEQLARPIDQQLRSESPIMGELHVWRPRRGWLRRP
jgi:hypothetical protein